MNQTNYKKYTINFVYFAFMLNTNNGSKFYIGVSHVNTRKKI